MTKNEKTLEALCAILPRCGFKEDAYGHFQKDMMATKLDGEKVPSKVRVKIQGISVRLELKRDVPGSEWNKIDGAYLKDIVVSSEGVKIGCRVIKVSDE